MQFWRRTIGSGGTLAPGQYTIVAGTCVGNDPIVASARFTVISPTHPATTTTTIAPNQASVAPRGELFFTATVTDVSSTPTNPTGTISFGEGFPAVGGGFVAQPCHPSGNNQLVCTVIYHAPFKTGRATITARYPGDQTHDQSSAPPAIVVVGKISLKSVSAIQAPEGQFRLVRGKSTVLQLVIDNPLPDDKVVVPVRILIRDHLPTGPILSRTISDTLILNNRPPNDSEDKIFVAVQSPIVPEGDLLDVTATLDPDDIVSGVDKADNIKQSVNSVKKTRLFRILFEPIGEAAFPFAQSLIPSSSRAAPSYQEMSTFATNAEQFLQATYPVADFRVFTGVSPFRQNYITPTGVFFGGGFPQQKAVLKQIAEDAALSGFDKGVGVLERGWLGRHFLGYGVLITDQHPTVGVSLEGISGVIIEKQENSGTATAHEISHTFGWVTPGHPLEDPDNPRHLPSTLAAPGYWVSCRTEIPARGAVCGSVTVGPASFEDFTYHDGVPNVDRWIHKSTFEFLLSKLTLDPADPEVILLSGLVFKDNTVAFDPWYKIDGPADIPLDHPGSYRVVYLDKRGNRLAETGFDLNFGAPNFQGESDVAALVVKIPSVQGTAKIVIQNGQAVIAQRVVSEHPPVVEVTHPNGGEVFTAGDEMVVKWRASARGKAKNKLAYAILMSKDAGTTWLPLAVDWTGMDFSFNLPPSMISDAVLIKVLATDGVNTGQDVSDLTFAILRNTLPVANAGLPQTVPDGTIVILDGSQSFDTNGLTSTLSFSWTQIHGPNVALQNPTSISPTFVAPPVHEPTRLTFQLVVNDGHTNSVPATVKVRVVPPGHVSDDDEDANEETDRSSRADKGQHMIRKVRPD